MLGIIIGVGAVIALVGFGQGVERYVKKQFESIGSNLLFIFTSVPPSGDPSRIKPMTMSDLDAIANPLYAPSVARASAEYAVFAFASAGKNEIGISVSGVLPQHTTVFDWYPDAGRFIDEADIAVAGRVAVLGKSAIKKLFDPSVDPVGQTIQINNLPFRVIGTMEARGGSAFGDQDLTILVPITTTQTRLATARTNQGDYLVSVVYAQALSAERMESAVKEITELMLDRHKIEFQDDQDFTIISQDQVLGVVGRITGLLTIFLALIAGISLVVGGIGIMNIMLVSVTERTREIGLRKAVGATSRDILLQFLIESIVISLIGGSLGIVFGWIATVIGTLLIPDLSPTVTPISILIATGVSSAIGVFFGLYPANRAASLSPIKALKYE
jgi:putative ABC transport system permease protein